MHYFDNQQIGDMGELIVKKEFIKLFKWPCRGQEIDLGIDAEFEVMLEDHSSSGKIVKVQIKSTATPFKDGTNTIYPDREHIEYWKKITTPVILCAVNVESEEILWKVIDADFNYDTPKGAKIELDRTADRLTKASKLKLEKIATDGNNVLASLAKTTMNSLQSFIDSSGVAWLSIDSPKSLEQHAANEEAILLINRMIALSNGRLPASFSKTAETLNRLWNQIDMSLDRQKKEDLY